jgi:A/G-specific adenine glycosylase
MADDAAAWNEAMMDLGASLCRPKAPQCAGCPVSAWCTGPEIYEPPPSQARFEGSRRQTRGAVIRLLTRRQATLADLAEQVGRTPIELEDILEDLEAEGLIVSDGGDRYSLPD